ncbi:MAG TPA: 30S ribosomal protein S9 [Balneolales bacterium]|nr:30S ribosomal protein S9 [Balneolales bacterium]
MVQQQSYIGRRKTSTARVYIKPGNGEIIVNKKKLEDYFPLKNHQIAATLPLALTEMTGKYDIIVTVSGGGLSGQSGAVSLGLARALDDLNEDVHGKLKSNGLLTRDDRMVERKKYGRPKARKRFQFSKR